MKIFISWSGTKSKRVAALLDEWLKGVIQAAEPFVSTNIDRGASWLDEINTQLLNFDFGIICLTLENKDAPWIHFEAGAIAKGLTTNRVCTFLIDLDNEEVQQPLAQFNHTYPVKENLFNLVNTINKHTVGRHLDAKTLEKQFELNWPDFERSFADILNDPSNNSTEKKRTTENILKELLASVRSFDNRMRIIQKDNATDKFIRIFNTSKNSSDFEAKLLPLFNSIADQIQIKLAKGIPKEQIIKAIKNPFDTKDIRDPYFFDQWLNKVIDAIADQ